jgi:hypothetical protein
MSKLTKLVEVKLSKLGDSSAQVCSYLLLNGFVGIRESPESCPIANYLKSDSAIIDSFEGIDVREVVLADEYVRMPDTVIEFIDRFDRGDFPDLVVEFAPSV